MNSSLKTALAASTMALLVAACGDAPSARIPWVPDTADGGKTDTAGGTSQGGAETSAAGDEEGGGSTTGPLAEQDLVEVAHEREFRGVWVATVDNINFPSQMGISTEQMKTELRNIVETLDTYNLNAIVFQVRPECDAYYPSDLEPWSRYLTGTQGGDPGFDPLQFIIDESHLRGIEVHAWLNPYRAKLDRTSQAVAPHLTVTHPEYAYDYGNHVWMDPGAEVVKDYTVDVILDVVSRYDVDGIHFDDYFYPYPNNTDFPDNATWQAYVNGGGQLDRGDWRRENVHQLVQTLHEEITALDPDVRFGISPFGIYRPGHPAGITGFDQYTQIFADPMKWMDEGWVDYLAPQLYWPTTQTAQAYEPLLEWWSTHASGGRYIFAGNFLSKLGTEPVWSVEELAKQVELSRKYRPNNSMGNIFFQIKPFQTNQANIASIFAERFYQQQVLTPPLAARRDVPVTEPLVEVSGTTATVTRQRDEPLRAYVVYRDQGAGFELERVVPVTDPTTPATFELEPGTWAISAAGKHNVESMGVRVVVE